MLTGRSSTSFSYYYLKSVFETFVEYFRNCSVPGYKYLVGRNKYERLFWLFIHLSLLLLTYFIWTYNWTQFTASPTITTLESYSYPVDKIDMPAVSVCPINKITLSRAIAYGERLANISGKPFDTIFDYVKLFGRFYDYSLSPEDEEKLIAFDNFFEQYNLNENGIFDTNNILKSLQISCDLLLSDCKWKNKKYNCEELFVAELTMDGYCCVFNYYSILSTTMVAKILVDNNFKPLKSSSVFEDDGLSFKVYTNESDFFYTTFASVGTKLLFSLPADFPDTTSGSLTEKIVGQGTEAFMKISTTTTYSTDEVRKYSIEKRNCVFDDEERTLFGSYSFSNCIMSCKINTIIALCDCIPFNYIKVFPNSTADQCTLADLKCVSNYYVKLNTIFPKGGDDEEFMQEKQNSLQCSTKCVAACSDTIYKISSESNFISNQGNTPLNYSIVHVYFDQPYYGVLNIQDVYYYWFDIVGLFGGLCSLILGMSVINVIEFIYFFTYRYYLQLRNKLK